MTSLRFQNPKPGVKISVIGAGLPRTGTNSFCAALQILLDGPCYHSGVQWGAPGAKDEKHIKAMIRAAQQYPWDSPTKDAIEQDLHNLLDGYVAVADPPLSILYPELLRLYPDAKVIVTIRDQEPWIRSMLSIIKTSQPKLAGFLFFLLPSVRWLPTFATALTNLFYQKYGVQMLDSETCITTWERHHAQLEQIVPKDQLFYFNVKDGWDPLCKALDRPVPKDSFPRLNDAKDLEDHFKNLALKGLARWALLIVCLVLLTCAALISASRGSGGIVEVIRNKHTTISTTGIGLLLLAFVLKPYV